MDDKQLAQALYQAGLLTQDQIRAAAEQRAAGMTFADVVVRNGWVTSAQIREITGGAADVGTPSPWGTPATPPAATPPAATPPVTPYEATPPDATSPATAPPPYSAPIPEPTGYSQSTYTPPGAGGVSSPRPGTVSVDAIGEAWNMWKANSGNWLAAIAILFIVSMIFGGIQNVAVPKGPNNQPEIGPVWFMLTLISFVINSFLTAGLLRMAIQNVRTGRAEVSEMFNVTDVIGNIMLAALLTTLAVALGFVLCIIPGIILALGLSMTNQLVVDQKLGAIEAMTRSWDVMKSHLLSMFVLGIALFLVNILGVIACCVGVLVTAGVTYLTLAIVYRDVFLATGDSSPPAMPRY